MTIETTSVPRSATAHVDNSTDATQGEPLAVRVRARQAELAQLLAQTPGDQLTARSDIEIALAHVDDLLTGDVEHLSDATAAALSGWLEANKHLAERVA
jgi:hypothetical protein